MSAELKGRGRVDGLRLEARDGVELLDRGRAEARQRAEDRTSATALLERVSTNVSCGSKCVSVCVRVARF